MVPEVHYSSPNPYHETTVTSFTAGDGELVADADDNDISGQPLQVVPDMLDQLIHLMSLADDCLRRSNCKVSSSIYPTFTSVLLLRGAQT
jgi:hypothetical protein